MIHNIQKFKSDAKKQGFSGLRTAGEMSWIYDRTGLAEEALD